MSQISAINGQSSAVLGTAALSQAKSAAGASGASFADALQEGFKNLNLDVKQADTAVKEFATGQARTIPEVIIALEKADMSLKFVTQVRNKVVDAYSEIMRMPV